MPAPKCEAEMALRELADDRFHRPTAVTGLSTVFRRACALTRFSTTSWCQRLHDRPRYEIHSDGTPWRPVVHVQDVARAFQAVLEAPRELVHDQAFNTGADDLNHQIRDLAEFVVKTVPGCDLSLSRSRVQISAPIKAGFR